MELDDLRTGFGAVAGAPSRGKAGRPPIGRDISAEVANSVLRSGGRRVAELASEIGVSEVTIRRSLDALERRGILKRFHGEARPYDGDAIPFRMGLHVEAKRRIAELAESLVREGDTILLEAGSAVAYFAERLRSKRGLSVITPNLFIARIFRGSGVRVVVVGGAYQEESESLVGSMAVEAIAGAGFSKAFIGVSGFTVEAGFTLNDFARAEISRSILARGAENWVLTDSSKFGQTHAASIAEDLSGIRGIVTDAGLPGDCRLALEASRVDIRQ